MGASQACIRDKPFTLDELFDNAEVIVRATAIRYAKPPGDMRTTGVPDSTIEFRVEEKLRGRNLRDAIIINGYLSDWDDFNEMPVPYMFVRPGGRSGSCFANTYKEGAQFLLFLKKAGDVYTADISPLGPTNEQLHSNDDPWLVWVTNHLKTLSHKSASIAGNALAGAPEGWAKLNICHISFLAPSDMKDLGAKGLDSCVAQFANNDITLYLDYGWYGSPPRQGNSDLEFKEESVSIDGKNAQLVTYVDSSHSNSGLKYNAGIYVIVKESKLDGFPKIISLMMSVRGERRKDQETAQRIFRSICFE
jgi:hypothetical protein